MNIIHKFTEDFYLLRFLTNPYQSRRHKGELFDINCASESYGSEGCSFCHNGYKPVSYWLIGAINKQIREYQIFEIHDYDIFNQIREMARDPNRGNPMNYDLEFEKKNNKYYVSALPLADLTKEESNLKDQINLDFLKQKTKPSKASCV